MKKIQKARKLKTLQSIDSKENLIIKLKQNQDDQIKYLTKFLSLYPVLLHPLFNLYNNSIKKILVDFQEWKRLKNIEENYHSKITDINTEKETKAAVPKEEKEQEGKGENSQAELAKVILENANGQMENSQEITVPITVQSLPENIDNSQKNKSFQEEAEFVHSDITKNVEGSANYPHDHWWYIGSL